MLSSATPPTSSYTSKRQSLNLSVGPRPLQLLEGGSSTPTSSTSNGPKTPLVSSPSSSNSPTSMSSPNPSLPSRHPRRQSSISYNPPPRDRNYVSPPPSASTRSATFAQHSRSLSRSMTYHGSNSSSRPAKSGEVEQEDDKERPPLTLVEKHADILHFIAQKESKCLELRSQLAVHEAELLQLKRKWERIVSRGLEKERPLSAGPDALEGIREGVQGLSRFIGYGLPAAPGSSSHTRSGSHAPMSTPPTLKRHNRTPTSSTSTTTSVSAASTAPTSVMGDSPVEKSSENEPILTRRRSRTKEVLMVRDTGASPIMSPNPDFPGDDNEERDEQAGDGDMNYPPSSPSKSKAIDPLPSSSKRMSMPLMEFDSKTVSSWVGNVMGKKWEEQLTKNQRRASTMLADVSHSIAQALTSPPPPGPSAPSRSILDEEVGGQPALMPTMSPSPASTTPVTAQKPKRTKPMTLPKTPKTPGIVDEEDEWNW